MRANVFRVHTDFNVIKNTEAAWKPIASKVVSVSAICYLWSTYTLALNCDLLFGNSLHNTLAGQDLRNCAEQNFKIQP